MADESGWGHASGGEPAPAGDEAGDDGGAGEPTELGIAEALRRLGAVVAESRAG